jgi:hypothetical protein
MWRRSLLIGGVDIVTTGCERCFGVTISTTCYATGLRISEAAHLKPTHIDSQHLVIRVEQTATVMS